MPDPIDAAIERAVARGYDPDSVRRWVARGMTGPRPSRSKEHVAATIQRGMSPDNGGSFLDAQRPRDDKPATFGGEFDRGAVDMLQGIGSGISEFVEKAPHGLAAISNDPVEAARALGRGAAGVVSTTPANRPPQNDEGLAFMEGVGGSWPTMAAAALGGPGAGMIAGGLQGGAAALEAGEDPAEGYAVGSGGVAVGELAGNVMKTAANATRSERFQYGRNVAAQNAVREKPAPQGIKGGLEFPRNRADVGLPGRIPAEARPPAQGPGKPPAFGERGHANASALRGEHTLEQLDLRTKKIREWFGKREDALADQIQNAPPLDPLPYTKVLTDAIGERSARLPNGQRVPLLPEQVAKLAEMREALAAYGQAGIPVAEAIKFRRAFDDIGDMGKVAGQDDVPWRMARDSMAKDIAKAAPELDKLYKAYSVELKRVENAHDALVASDDAVLPGRVGQQRKGAGAMRTYGQNTGPQAIADRALDAAAEPLPFMRRDLDLSRASRGRMENVPQMPGGGFASTMKANVPAVMRLADMTLRTAGVATRTAGRAAANKKRKEAR